MKKVVLSVLPFLGLLSACNSAKRVEIPNLPESAETKTFTYASESFIRGVKGSPNTVPRGRPAAILDVTYEISCLSGNEPSAEARFENAKTIIDKRFKVAPLYYDNPRERGSWKRNVNSLLVEKAGCQSKSMKFGKKVSDKTQVLIWVVRNKPDLITKNGAKKG